MSEIDLKTCPVCMGLGMALTTDIEKVIAAEKRIEELQSRNLSLSTAYATQRDAKERLVEDYAELQHKYESLVEAIESLPTWFVHNGAPVKRNPKATIQGAFVKVDVLRALLEADDD